MENNQPSENPYPNQNPPETSPQVPPPVPPPLPENPAPASTPPQMPPPSGPAAPGPSFEPHKEESFIRGAQVAPVSQEDKAPWEDIPDKPIIPSSAKKETSDWSSAEKESFRIQHDDDKEKYSPQSLQAIEMIAKGLEDDNCTQIDSYGPGKFSAQYKGRQTIMEGVSFASHDEYEAWIKSIVDDVDALIDWDYIQKHKQGTLALPGGQRLHLFVPPVTTSIVFSLRKHTASAWPNERFIELGMLDKRMLGFLQACVAAHVNILFVGEMGSGKSSLMRALISSSVGDDEKIAVLESIPELSLEKPLAIPMLYQNNIKEIHLDEILDGNLYFGLSRLIVGEIHMQGLAKMLESMIITEGSMSTYHAFSSDQAAERMKTALQMEYGNMEESTAASYIRNAIELVVVIQKINDVRRVVQITEIDWRKSSGSEVLGGRDIFQFDRAKKKFKATARLDETGRLVEKIRNTSIGELPSEWFIEAEDLKKFLQ